MKKSLLVFTLASLFSIQSKGQYSSIWAAYPTGYEVSSGFATKNTPGMLWFGYNPTVQNVNSFWHINKNFCVMGGGASAMWAAYKVFESNACTGALTQVLNGYGVSVVETQGSGVSYALAGSYDNACYFCTLDKFGNVISNVSYPFPYTPLSVHGTPSKPIIIESNIKEEYYICGYFESDMYIINVDITGSIIWSSFYSVGIESMPKDLMMNPYMPGELVVIGETKVAPTNNQGFLMFVDGNNGSVINSRIYGNSIDNEGFGSITAGSYVEPNNPSGFVIGGYTQRPNGVIGVTSWVIKLDPLGNYIWSKILEPSMGINSGVIDIAERLNSFNKYEYYALMSSSQGMQVLKLDESGSPFPVSPPNNLYNEFVYDIPGLSVSKATCLSYVNNQLSNSNQLTNANAGIQVFGTASNFPGFSSSYVVSAYFNGETNCYKTLGTIQREEKGEKFVRHSSVAKFGTFSACSNFSIQAIFPGGSVNYPCSGLMANGSNQRTMSSGTSIQSGEQNNYADFGVYPNPVVTKASVNYSVSDNGKVDIYLYSLLGEQILHIEPQIRLAGTYSEEIDFSSLDLVNGIYFVTTVVDGVAHKQKIVYTH